MQTYTVQSFSIKNKSRLASRKPGSKSFCPSVFEGNYQVQALSDGLPLETPSLTMSIKPEGSSYCKYHNKANPVKTDSGQTYMHSSESWQHRQVQTSMRALVWAFWSHGLNFQSFKFVLELILVIKAANDLKKYHIMVWSATDQQPVLSATWNVFIFST